MQANDYIAEAVVRRIREYREKIRVGSRTPHWEIPSILHKLEELEAVMREAGVDVEVRL